MFMTILQKHTNATTNAKISLDGAFFRRRQRRQRRGKIA